jgi:hypothetical protein
MEARAVVESTLGQGHHVAYMTGRHLRIEIEADRPHRRLEDDLERACGQIDFFGGFLEGSGVRLWHRLSWC